MNIMEVIDQLQDFVKPDYSVVTIGTFDGVHLGHQIILKKVVEEAKKNKGKSILITFWPHPRFILNPGDDTLKLLSTFQEKVRLIEHLGVDFLVKLAFTPEFSNLSADEFVKQILIDGVGTKKLFIGYDHHFGNNREGNIDFLINRADEYGFEVSEIPRQDIDHMGVSSTKIRNALNEGDIPMASMLLGRNFSICGTVIHGNKKGRSIGFPTANIVVSEPYKILPRDGVYAVKVAVDNREWPGMMNIGFRPTIKDKVRSVEVHLFNFEGNLYDRFLIVKFIGFLRPEMKFQSLEELKNQLKKDQIEALKLLI